MRWNRDDYLALMTFGHAPRPMFVELFGLLIGVDAEWRQQGASDDEINMTAFDWDYVSVARPGGNTGVMGGFQRVVLEETADYLIERDYLGRTVKLPKGYATISLPLDFPVKSMDDWLKFKPMYAYDDRRVDESQITAAKLARDKGALVVANIPGAFDTARELMGEEVACMAYYDQPELMNDILDTLRDTSLKVLDRVSSQITIDQLSVHEDLAGKGGPLAGPAQVDAFFKPYFRPVWDMLRSRGTRIFEMDTDGNVNAVIEPLLNCGLTAMHPMEPAAGMDIVQVRQRWGDRLAMRGGIDKFVLRGTREDIRRELEYKMQPMMRRGGVVFGLDHRIPNGTPLDSYRHYVAIGREILGLPPVAPNARGWQRMAF